MAIDETLLVVGVAPRIGRETFGAILREHRSPAGDEAEAGWDAVVAENVDPLFALAIFHQESQFGTDGICFTEGTFSPGNTRSSRTGIGDVFQTADLGNFVRYPSWAEGWRDLAFRLVDPAFVYHQERLQTIGPIIRRWAPASDPNTGTIGPNKPEEYIRRVIANMTEWQDILESDEAEDRATGDVVFGRVPHPPFEDHLIPDHATVAYDDLGQRNPVGTCVHRLDGPLVGTDGWLRSVPDGNKFACPDPDTAEAANWGGCRAMTDYVIGGAIDGDLDGAIWRWNDPTGAPHPGVSANRSPWANGKTNGLKENGRIFFDTCGQNAVNRDLVSIELSGWSNETWHGKPETPVSDAQFESLCQLVAYWHDQARVPWDVFPSHPTLGIVTQLQHREFTGVKDCPFPAVKNLTLQYRERVKQIMREAQTGTTGGAPHHDDPVDPQREVPIEPRTRFVKPSRPPEFDGSNKQIRDVLFHAARQTVEVAEPVLHCRKWADPSAPETRRPLTQGDTFEALYWINGVNVRGERRWWVSTTGTRIWVGGTVQKPS
ncbi:MAG: hypothetical protein AVDCRST_MAG73-1263 [uncultured Thermomicrobiales bacterium]|uniref:N-acetylmuramoyl-L-alanine amidase domain-containing protein n=1 Tax=uncultured Thermomicrobiales bacterium TaxID=1645740 RepID=A0A6J4TXV9_9BACT|nr:MAG: hypothetical protein AVDCRST_MAG73-1263 [uncultured Thermomicrobiales bacterium]